MAEDVAPQEDLTDEGGVRTLHLKVLRKQWQVVAVQVIATLALICWGPSTTSELRCGRRHGESPAQWRHLGGQDRRWTGFMPS